MATRACPRHTWFRLQFLFLRSRFAVLTFMTVAVRSFAKINLGLYIGARRADGFHELRTVYQTIALHDVIRVSVGRAAEGLRSVQDDPRVPLDSSNTCYRMAALVMEAAWRVGQGHHGDREEAAGAGRAGRGFVKCGGDDGGAGAALK